MMQQRKVLRRSFAGIGALLLALSIAVSNGSVWMFAPGLIAVFLGVTDFGRQCPLLLSARHMVYRIKIKGQGRRVTVAPIDEAGGKKQQDEHT
jgi:hypothetical protein